MINLLFQRPGQVGLVCGIGHKRKCENFYLIYHSQFGLLGDTGRAFRFMLTFLPIVLALSEICKLLYFSAHRYVMFSASKRRYACCYSLNHGSRRSWRHPFRWTGFPRFFPTIRFWAAPSVGCCRSVGAYSRFYGCGEPSTKHACLFHYTFFFL